LPISFKGKLKSILKKRRTRKMALTKDVFSCQNLHTLLEATEEEKGSDNSTSLPQMVPPTCLPSTSSSSNSSVNNNDLKGSKNCAIFDQISYLGSSKIENPLSEKEMLQIVGNFNEQKAHDSISVIIIIPNFAGGIVRLYEQTSRVEISSFPVQRIRFCARGKINSPERACFALSFTQFIGNEEVNQCHVFRCHFPDTAGKALLCFANAFRNTDPTIAVGITPSSPRIGSAPPAPPGTEEDYQFEAFLEIKEEDGKKGYTLCAVEKNCFKLRRDREKRVVVVIRQVSGPRSLAVKKCFGLLLGMYLFYS
jgi:hypothetical protein